MDPVVSIVYIINGFVLLVMDAFRSPLLDRAGCQRLNGSYIREPSGWSCYYDECPGHMAPNNKCYRKMKFMLVWACKHGYHDGTHCYYDFEP